MILIYGDKANSYLLVGPLPEDSWQYPITPTTLTRQVNLLLHHLHHRLKLLLCLLCPLSIKLLLRRLIILKRLLLDRT